jgi:hypothetical protein
MRRDWFRRRRIMLMMPIAIVCYLRIRFGRGRVMDGRSLLSGSMIYQESISVSIGVTSRIGGKTMLFHYVSRCMDSDSSYLLPSNASFNEPLFE